MTMHYWCHMQAMTETQTGNKLYWAIQAEIQNPQGNSKSIYRQGGPTWQKYKIAGQERISKKQN